MASKKRGFTGRRKKTAKTSKNRRRAKQRKRSFGDKITGAYSVVVDTFRGTDRLRKKIEPPGTSETE